MYMCIYTIYIYSMCIKGKPIARGAQEVCAAFTRLHASNWEHEYTCICILHSLIH